MCHVLLLAVYSNISSDISKSFIFSPFLPILTYMKVVLVYTHVCAAAGLEMWGLWSFTATHTHTGLIWEYPTSPPPLGVYALLLQTQKSPTWSLGFMHSYYKHKSLRLTTVHLSDSFKMFRIAYCHIHTFVSMFRHNNHP